MRELIGRETERELLQDIMSSGNPELVAVYGRRRVGKTYLIRKFLSRSLVFEFTGTFDASLVAQLSNFSKAMNKAVGSDKIYQTPETWADALEQLGHYLVNKKGRGRQVVFFDEFPWLNTPKSAFLPAFEHWWNSWASRQKRLVVVICGSAASWMIQNIVNNKGGLHNRVTRKIRLLPFDLKETEAFLKSQKVNIDRYQILQLYMAMGGIPHYLKEVKKGESAIQAIDRVCFSKDGLLTTEFKNLFYSLFDDPSRHIAVVKALADHNSGLTRTEIVQKTGLSSGGTLTGIVDELTESGFVSEWSPYDKKTKDTIYKLADEYSHFYLKFIDKRRISGTGSWQRFSAGQSWKSWSGVAFERIGLKHLDQIKYALGIHNLFSETTAWRYQPKDGKGAQIDLLIDRSDGVIHLCEMKFSTDVFTIDKSYAADLENRREIFRNKTRTKKSVFLTFISTFGLKQNDYARRAIQNDITMDTLFGK